MRAATYNEYGPPEVVHLRDVPDPVPRDDEVCIQTRATTVSSGDYRARSLDVPRGFGWMSRLMFGVRRPRQPILGSEIAGTVAAVGAAVRGFRVGDSVIAFSDTKMGAHAEYRCLPEGGNVVPKPDNLDFDQAAALSFGGTTALHFLRKAKVEAGTRVLINGASGAVGTACVQLAARHFGAEVIGVCSSANVELVRSLGASRVVDYTRDDFAAGDASYDVIVDTVGTAPYARSRRALADGGRLVLVFGSLGDLLRIPWVSVTSKHKVVGGVALGRPDDLRLLADLAEARTFEPVIDRRYAFDDIVDAHRYVGGGHKRGNVVVELS